MNLAARYEDLKQEARELALEVEPFAAAADESSTLRPEVLALLARSRLSRLMVPAEYGGYFEAVDPLAVCVVREILMPACSHLDSLFALQGIGSFGITAAGSAAQKTTWLPRVATTEALAALALTEPDAGSDLHSISTTVVERDGELHVTGRKAFISNGGVAAFYLVLAREGDGYTVILIPANTASLSIRAAPELMAAHVLANLELDDVRLPSSARVGKAGDGFDLVLSTLAIFRASVAGAAVGLAQAALEEAVRHTRSRVQFGRPLIRQGPVAQLIADSWMEIEAARLLTYRAAEQAKDTPRDSINLSSMAKVLATETAGRVVDRCVQVMGRFGLEKGSKIERYYRQARPMRIYEGATEVLKLTIARKLSETVV